MGGMGFHEGGRSTKISFSNLLSLVPASAMYGRCTCELGDSRQASPAQRILLAHHHMCSSRLLVYNFTPNKECQAFGFAAIGHLTHTTPDRTTLY